MARVVKCPICGKIKKIKHNHYANFTCCYKKFPISEHDIVRKQYGSEKAEQKEVLEEPKEPSREPRALKVLQPIEKSRKTAMTAEEADNLYKYKCGTCGCWFDEFVDKCCPNEKCGARLLP